MILLLLICGLKVASQEKFTLTIEIENVKNNKGKVLVMLSNSEKDFLKKGEGKTLAINNNKVIAVFENVVAGEYAFSFFHDKDNNGKLNTNFIGIPTEGYGFSNNAKGFMGPPSYEKSKFTISGNTKLVVSF